MRSSMVRVAMAIACGAVPAVVEQDPAVSPTLAFVDLAQSPIESVPQYGAVEIAFQLAGSGATDLQWPYDPAPPPGVPAGTGVSVDAVFVDPSGRAFRQPAFHAAEYADAIVGGRDWSMPTGRSGWHVRFTPTEPGDWTYTLVARDVTGTATGGRGRFTVAPANGRGFIRVAAADPRYFEYDDGTLFTGLGFEFPEFLDAPLSRGGPAYRDLAGSGVTFVRLTAASIFGSAWTPWVGARHQYRGYLPITGLVPFAAPGDAAAELAMKLDYEVEGDTGWFDACRVEAGDAPESVEPNHRYRLRVEYAADGLDGPRDAAHSGYGLVAKIGGTGVRCHEPGNGTPVTEHGHDTGGWHAIEGEWRSSGEPFLPPLVLALENVRRGAVWIRRISLREDLGGGRFGPELMRRSSMAYEREVSEARAHAFDQIVRQAERSGVALKVVVSDLNDKIYLKMADAGGWVGAEDNLDGYYGLGRGVNRTRWLQQMWWRYLQARWGYSPAIHSWELLNEGDPHDRRHFETADEFGKFMRCRVFDVAVGAGDGERCTFAHPNRHLVTTSFWRGLPANEFWNDPRYPNLDYVDLHAYVSTSEAPVEARREMEGDAAFFHLWHARMARQAIDSRPVVRGEAGLDAVGAQDPDAIGLSRDRDGIWLHNFLWSGLDAGALYEIYWWNAHIWSGRADHRPAYAAVANFLADVPLNRGGYVDWGGTVSGDGLRVVGQKHPEAGRLHLWVQNRRHTWRTVAMGRAVPAASGVVTVPGFVPDAVYRVERWDTWTPGGRVRVAEDLTADAGGRLRIGIQGLLTDEAIKVTGTVSRQDRKESER